MNAIVVLGQGAYLTFFQNYLRVAHPSTKLIVCSSTPKRDDIVAEEFLLLPENLELETIRDYCARNSYNIVGIINRTDFYENLHGALVDLYKVPGPSYKSVSLFTNKAEMHKLMIAHGMSQYRPTTQILDLEDVPAMLDSISYPVVIKPFTGAKSRGIFVLNHPEDFSLITQQLKQHFKTELALRLQRNKRRTVLIEEYLSGKQVTPITYVDDKGKCHTLALVDVHTARDAHQNHMQLTYRTIPSEFGYETVLAVNTLMQKIVDASGLKSTCLHGEFIIEGDRLCLIELNTRIGGYRARLMKLAFNYELDDLCLKLALGENKVPQQLHMISSATLCEVWRELSGYIQSIEFPSSERVEMARVNFMRGDYYEAPPKGNVPLAHFFVTHPTDSLAIAKLTDEDTVVKYMDNAGPIV